METTEHPITQRIKILIESRFNGNVTSFSKALGYDSPQKVNRLFAIDKRTGKHPKPSTNIIGDISNKLDINSSWLLDGLGDPDEKTKTTTNMKNHDLEIEMLRQRIRDLEDKLEMCKELREKDRLLLDKSL